MHLRVHLALLIASSGQNFSTRSFEFLDGIIYTWFSNIVEWGFGEGGGEEL